MPFEPEGMDTASTKLGSKREWIERIGGGILCSFGSSVSSGEQIPRRVVAIGLLSSPGFAFSTHNQGVAMRIDGRKLGSLSKGMPSSQLEARRSNQPPSV